MRGWLLLLGLVLAGVGVGLAPWEWLLSGALLLICLLHPTFSVAGLIISVTAQDSLQLFGFNLTQVLAVLAALRWLIWLAFHPADVWLNRTTLAWGIWLALLLLSASLSPYGWRVGLPELWRWGVAFLTWLIISTTTRSPWQLTLVVAAILIGPAINALIGLRQFWIGDGPPTFLIPGTPYTRAYGTIGQPNSFAGYLNTAWPIALALLSTAILQLIADLRERRWPAARTIALAAGPGLITMVLLAGLAASFSRGAWVGAACGAFTLAVLVVIRFVRQRCTQIGLIAAAIIGGMVVWVVLPEPIRQRLQSIGGAIGFFDPSSVVVTPANFAVVERMAQLWAGWQLWLSHPIIGVGPGAYNLGYAEVTSPPWLASRGHAHNYYLHVLAEVGLLGLVAYLGLLAMVIGDIRRGLHQTGGIVYAALFGICGMIAAVAGHNLFENLHVLHMSVSIAASWGVAAVLARPYKGI
jgi:O-antigen ligase